MIVLEWLQDLVVRMLGIPAPCPHCHLYARTPAEAKAVIFCPGELRYRKFRCPYFVHKTER